MESLSVSEVAELLSSDKFLPEELISNLAGKQIMHNNLSQQKVVL